MKRIVLFCAMIVLLSGSSYASGDKAQQGIQLYKKHHYEEAGSMLRSHLHTVKPDNEGGALLSLGMIYLANAKLYRELYNTSVFVHLDYLDKLSAASGKTKSRFLNFYLGKVLLEAGKPDRAASFLQKFITEKKIKTKYKDIAKTNLGLSFYLKGQTKTAKQIWSTLNMKDPVVLSGLAAAYSKVGLNGEKSLIMCEKALNLETISGKAPSIQVINNAIAVYAEKEHVEKGLDLLKKVDLRTFSLEEILDKNKVVRFYDTSLLNNLSLLYGKASLKYLKKAAENTKVKTAAQYYLGEANTQFGNIAESVKAFDLCISAASLPEQYKNKANVWQTINRYGKGNKVEVKRRLNNLSQQEAEPYLLADILSACSILQVECPDIIKKASALAETDEGKRFKHINFALGKYYLWKGDYVKAVSYMEAGRDKSNKNKIEYNEPLMLVNLAEAYYRIKKFSEALEIYFEMSKQFPPIRQIQIAMQGVYSIEQKSAGDAKLF
jgi:tetratricopeptide (TPR) repeat protein